MIYSSADVVEKIVESVYVTDGDVCQFDDRRFHFGAYLVNPDGNVVRIERGSIEELVIVDDITEWFHSGTMIFLNPGDALEKKYKKSKDDKETQAAGYSFRGDGRDMLYIHMSPIIEKMEPGVNTAERVKSSVYTFKFLFTIYATEDIIDDRGKKHKKQKLYFHDYRLQLLREKNSYYSTGKFNNVGSETVETKSSICHLPDKYRSKQTGLIIQDILAGVLPANDVKNKFSRYWDFGSREMLYTSPSEFKSIDDIEYLMSRHVSAETNEPSLLRLERFTDRWELLPVSEYFKRAVRRKNDELAPGVYQSECFYLTGEQSASPSKEIPTLAKFFGVKEGNPTEHYHLPDVSLIDDYIFSEINGIDCQEILNSVVVHRYDESTKTFGVDVSTGNISTVNTIFNDLYTSNMYGDSKTGGPITNWLVDSTRASNLNMSVQSSWSPDKTSSLSVGRNKKLLAAFLLGNTIQFNVRGATPRRSGVWISIDRRDAYEESDYDRKVLGQYFVTRTTHRITTESYRTDIIGVKPYSFGGSIDQPTGTRVVKDMFRTNPEEFNY